MSARWTPEDDASFTALMSNYNRFSMTLAFDQHLATIAEIVKSQFAEGDPNREYLLAKIDEKV